MSPGHQHGDRVSEPAAVRSALDPVCGMEVPESADLREHYAGETYVFCSAHCQAKFRESPEQFVSGGVVTNGHEPPSVEGAVYSCPMDPEVRQNEPGPCPKCGMALEPEVPAFPAERTEYVCPMHPEIVRDAPGSCPICGMALELRTVTAEEEENPELVDMRRRFWVSVVLSVPILVITMAEFLPGEIGRAHV